MTWLAVLHHLAHGPRPPMPTWCGRRLQVLKVAEDAEPALELPPADLTQRQGLKPVAPACNSKARRAPIHTKGKPS